MMRKFNHKTNASQSPTDTENSWAILLQSTLDIKKRVTHWTFITKANKLWELQRKYLGRGKKANHKILKALKENFQRTAY